MAEDPFPQLPPGMQWAPPAPAQPPEIPALPPGMQWQPRAPITVHESEKMPQMPGSSGPSGFERFFTGEGRAIDPTTNQPYREIRDLTKMLPLHEWGLGDVKNISQMMFFEGDEGNRAAFIAQKFPNAKVRREGREIIIDIPDIDPRTGKPIGAFTMNRVGMSAQDADELVRELTLMGPAARAAGWGSSLIRRALAGGAATGATEAARQGISTLAGARKAVSLPDVAMATAAGTILGGLSEAGFNLLRRAFATNALTTASGTMTPRGRLILERIGVDPGQVTLDTLRELEPLVARARNPEEALRLAQARALDVPVTRGDVARDPKMQALEQRIGRGGTFGTEVLASERRLHELKKPGGVQDEALASALGETSRRVSGRPTEFSPTTGQVVTPQGSTFEAAQRRLVEAAKEMRGQFKAAYQEAYDRGASLMPDKLRALSFDLQKIKEGYAAHPQVAAVADDLARMIKEAVAGGRTPVQLQQLEERVRKSISSLGQDNNAALKSAAGEMRSAYTKWESALTPDDFVKGGPEAVQAFQRGRQIRTDYASRFEDDPAISAMLKAKRMAPTQPGGKPTWEIEMQPSEAVRGILAKTGDRAAPTMERLKRVLSLIEGNDGPLWQGVKREVFAEISEKGAGGFARSWETFLRDRPKLAEIVFGQGDRAHMATMAGVANTTRPLPQAVNYSGTAYELARQLPLSNVGAALLGRAATGITPSNALRPFMPARAPGAVRAGAVMTGDQPEMPDAEMVARFLRSQVATPTPQPWAPR